MSFVRPFVCILTLSGCFELDLDLGFGGEDPPATFPSDACGEANCSDRTPAGLDFVGAPFAAPTFPPGPIDRAVVAHGSDTVLMRFGGGDNELDLEYAAVVVDPSVLEVSPDGPRIVLDALEPGTTDVRIFDPVTKESFQRKPFSVAGIASVHAVGVDEKSSGTDLLDSASTFAFAAGQRRVAIAFLDATGTKRLVDTNTQLSLAGATQIAWDTLELANATPGIHTIGVRAGTLTTTVDIEVVSGAHAIEPLYFVESLACFAARTEGGTFIAGLTWTFEINGQPAAGDSVFGPNCIFRQGPFTVTASAGGQSFTLTTGV